jgi:DnaD/phage-associated family protein
MSDDAQVIIDASDLRKYRTELPNLYDDSGLDVYEFRLLAHYKRVGRCTEGLPTTARICNMSMSQASETRKSLSVKKFIKLEKNPMGGGRYSYIVTVLDRWIENFAKYSGSSIDEINEQLKKGSPSPHEGSPSQSPSPHEGKKELKKIHDDDENARAKKSRVAFLYEQEIGALTPLIADAIRDAEKDFQEEWIIQALRISVERNVRNWKFVMAILNDSKAKGLSPNLNKKTEGAKNGNNGTGYKQGTKSSEPANAGVTQRKPTDADRAVAERVKARKQAELS